MNVRNATSYNGVPNKGTIRLNYISVATAVTNQTAVVRFLVGTAPGGSPAFTPTNGSTADNGITITAGNSIASIDTAGTAVATGVNYIFNFSYCGTGSTVVDLTPHEIFVPPGEVLSIYGVSTGNMLTNISVNWSEDV
jgi:hypothetical protein